MTRTTSVKIYVTGLILFLCGVVAAGAETNAHLTGNRSNGRYWRALSHNEKIEYITGYHEGIDACSSIKYDQPGLDREAQASLENVLGGLKKRLLPLGATYDDVVKYLDDFYAKPENMNKPISEVLPTMVSER